MRRTAADMRWYAPGQIPAPLGPTESPNADPKQVGRLVCGVINDLGLASQLDLTFRGCRTVGYREFHGIAHSRAFCSERLAGFEQLETIAGDRGAAAIKLEVLRGDYACGHIGRSRRMIAAAKGDAEGGPGHGFPLTGVRVGFMQVVMAVGF